MKTKKKPRVPVETGPDPKAFASFRGIVHPQPPQPSDPPSGMQAARFRALTTVPAAMRPTDW